MKIFDESLKSCKNKINANSPEKNSQKKVNKSFVVGEIV